MNIAIIAHDGKKPDMVSFMQAYKHLLGKVNLFATGTTGKAVIKATGLEVKTLLSGPLGGDAQIAALVGEGKLDMVVFFRDPLDKHPHEPDVQMLMRVCDVHNVPLATNPAGAKLMFAAIFKQ